jgi:hypothetical protein
MSPRGSNGDAQPDIYVGLLFVAMGAMLAAMVFLLIELNQYGYQMPG